MKIFSIKRIKDYMRKIGITFQIYFTVLYGITADIPATSPLKSSG
jgi:hypothetical protein